MTIETETFPTLDLAKQAKLRSGARHQAKWKALHTDFVNNEWKITWVNGTDDPENSPEGIQHAQDVARLKMLQGKLKARTLSQPELLELLESSL